jgi:hypothetical protein
MRTGFYGGGVSLCARGVVAEKGLRFFEKGKTFFEIG